MWPVALPRFGEQRRGDSVHASLPAGGESDARPLFGGVLGAPRQRVAGQRTAASHHGHHFGLRVRFAPKFRQCFHAADGLFAALIPAAKNWTSCRWHSAERRGDGVFESACSLILPPRAGVNFKTGFPATINGGDGCWHGCSKSGAE